MASRTLSPRALLLLGLVLLLVAALVLVADLATWRAQTRASESFSRVEGTVLAAELLEDHKFRGSDTFSPRIRSPVGGPILVNYDPADPVRSVLSAVPPSAAGFWFPVLPAGFGRAAAGDGVPAFAARGAGGTSALGAGMNAVPGGFRNARDSAGVGWRMGEPEFAAREELRRRLDREFGSQRAWVLVVGWGKPPASAPVGVFGVVVGGIVMKKVLAVAVVAVLLLGVGSFALWNWSEPASPPLAEQAQVVAANVVSPPPAAAPVREVAATEPIASAPAAPAAPSQHFRCIDEQGQPVANAEVRLVRMPWGSGVPDRIARSDAEGNVVVPDLVAASYAIRAHEGHRHHVVDPDPVSLPGAPRDLLLRELWVGGLVMPGVEVIQNSAGYLGFMFTDKSMAGPAAERDLIAEWRRKHPDGRFWAAVRNPRHPYQEGLEITTQWFGHQTHKRVVRMWPASQFQGPEVIDPATVPLREWVRCRVVLVDAAGQPVPAAVQAHLQKGYADLQGGIGQQRRSMMDNYTFHTGIAKVPVGDYELRLFNGLGTFVPAARCTFTLDTTELRVPVAIADRAVRLRLGGLPGAGYMLKIVHESGRTAQEMGRADGDHTLLLPPGPCLVTCGWLGANGRQESREHAFTITDAAEQEFTWDVVAPK